MNINKQIINRAIKVAKTSNVVRGKVGCCVFTNSGKIVAQASNSVTLGKLDKKIFTIHAERFAILKALKIKAIERFGKLNILVVRWKPSTNKMANAKPCEECRYYLKKIGFKVFYSNENGDIVEF